MVTQSGRNASHDCKEIKTGKDLKCPAARLTGPVRHVLSWPSISPEKMGVSDACRTNMIFMQKPDRTLLVKQHM
jgi:hypothetical protein